MMEMPDKKGRTQVVSISAIESMMRREMSIYDRLPKAVRDDLKNGSEVELQKWIDEQVRLRGNH